MDREAPATIQEAPNVLYPFKQSFDDLNVEIAEWVDDSINRVKYFESFVKPE